MFSSYFESNGKRPCAGEASFDLSVIIPIYNEADSIEYLILQLREVLDNLNARYEVICVDDGSKDGSFEQLASGAAAWPQLRVISFRRNYGQTAATMAGIDFARGKVIVSLDADLQNDPRDIPALLAKLDEGYDVVSGWRKDRQDAALRRNLPSRIANALISRITRVKLNDYGCTLKAYRAEVIQGIRLYGEMHRFIPIYATWKGARVTQMPVRHHRRRFGNSKYGINRVYKVLLDLAVVKFLDQHLVKPIYVFGGFGFIALFLSFLCGVTILVLKFAYDVPMIRTPLPLLTVLLFLVGFISILMGLLAELIVRTYFESQGRAPYLVGRTLNMERDDGPCAG